MTTYHSPLLALYEKRSVRASALKRPAETVKPGDAIPFSYLVPVGVKNTRYQSPFARYRKRSVRPLPSRSPGVIVQLLLHTKSPSMYVTDSSGLLRTLNHRP